MCYFSFELVAWFFLKPVYTRIIVNLLFEIV